MSVFSSSLKTTIIDPQFHSKDRCEFRLENRGQAYMPTLRLGNLGLSKTGPSPNEYQWGAGVAAVISRIRLMDGNEELDSLRNVAQWMTFKNALKSIPRTPACSTTLAETVRVGYMVRPANCLRHTPNRFVRAVVR